MYGISQRRFLIKSISFLILNILHYCFVINTRTSLSKKVQSNPNQKVSPHYFGDIITSVLPRRNLFPRNKVSMVGIYMYQLCQFFVVV